MENADHSTSANSQLKPASVSAEIPAERSATFTDPERRLLLSTAFSIYDRSANRFGLYKVGREQKWCTPRMGPEEEQLYMAAVKYLTRQFFLSE